ncbi:polyketide synthase [Polyplosphaeria fusca]|uniref:Polyketide synthase n=1 Tax=Polyplosphaeria fusca TaxID=682080 RepID=A0A9P4UZU9_9PLEO|nr:polyketide synthase [Polyplosphaeria fusca]
MAPGLIVTNGGDPSYQDQLSSGVPSPTLSQQPAEDTTMQPDEPHQLNDAADSEAPQLIEVPLQSNGDTPQNGNAPEQNGNTPHLNGDAPQNGNATNGANGHGLNGDTPRPNGLNGHFINASTPSVATPASEHANPLDGFKTPAPYGEANPNAGMPIAIIGIAVRAGSAATPDEFFEMLSRGRSGFASEIPAERFNNSSFYHPNAGKLGCINTNGASFIQGDLTKFDAPFFSITELEATSMDPQQRLLLECAFEALENAGVQKHATVGKDIGVFMGAGSPEYEFDLFRDSDTMPMFQATGNHLAMQSNKISHFFDWRGPSVTMDTACSSSLTAVHYGCQSLRNRESEVVLVGGCNLNLIPEFFINYSTSRLMGNEGKSFSFDARGTGYGRGEGCGMLLLKPLDQAVKDNDYIRAVISASGVNQDGYTPGITMPNGESQEALMRKIYRDAGLDPAKTGYVEAHGTGTRVGDPIEVTALRNVFGEGRSSRNPLYLGSVKSNIGHLESASGILAVIKVAVGMDRGFIMPNYDFQKGNPKIPFAEWGLKVPIRQMPWPKSKRFASINNFGFGGTNAHLVMERAPMKTTGGSGPARKQNPTKKLFVFSAADKAACQKIMSNLGVYLEQRPEMFERELMSNIAYTLGQRRSLLPWRVAIPSKESSDLVEKLAKGGFAPVKETGAPRIGFVCTGQGAQWWAMGRELYWRWPVFASVLDKADAVLTELGAPYSLIEELRLEEKTTRVNQAHISQPSCTAIQLGLVELLKTWGITPTAVVGHSSGEIAAAYAAGIVTVEAAMQIAYHRGRLVPVLKERYPDLQGTMMAIGCGKEEIDPLLQQLSNREARIACYNSPESLTISGDTPAVAELQQMLEDQQIFNRRLVIETAYHSHHMELIAEDYLNSIKQIPSPDKSDVRFFSSLTGKEATHAELDANYWVRNLTNPVKFAQAFTHLVSPTGDFSTGVDLIVEIGPHSAMQGPIKQTLKAVGGAAVKIPYAPSLLRKKDAVETMLALASTLFCKGSPIDLAHVNFPPNHKQPSLLIDLPRYPWNHANTYWHESRIAKVHKNRAFPRHDILGTLANYSNDLEPTWRNIVRLDDLPWLRHHQIQTLTIFPISGFVGMVIEAVFQQAKSKDIAIGQIELRDLNVHNPLMLPDESVEMTITLRSPQAADVSISQITSDFIIHSYIASKGWTENCTGTVTVKSGELNEVNGQRQLEQTSASLAEKISEIESLATSVPQSKIYDALAEMGVAYGSTFQGLTDCRADDKCAVANITIADTAVDMPEHFETKHIVHPSFLEQLIQMYWPILGAGRSSLSTVCLPASIGKITISPKVLELASMPGQSLRAYGTASKPLSIQKPSKVSMVAVADGEPIIDIEDLTIAPLPSDDVDSDVQAARQLCYKQIWEPILEPLEKGQEIRVDSPQTEAGAKGTALNATPVVIIHGSSPSQLEFARVLAASIESQSGAKVDMGALDEIDATDKQLLCITELDEFILPTLKPSQFKALQTLSTNSEGLLWVTRGSWGQGQAGDPTGSMVIGLSRAIRSENMYKFANLDLDAEERLADASAVQAILKVFKTVMEAGSVENTEMEFMERKGEFWTPRIVEDEVINDYVHKRNFPPTVEETKYGGSSRSLKMAIQTPGMFDSLYFVDDETRGQPLAADHIEIQVKAVAVSTRDVEAAVGHVDCTGFGEECSGVVTAVGKDVKNIQAGDRVAAIAPSAFATYARTSADFAMKVGANISFEEAASLPLAQCSAQYGLIDLAKLEDEESVLVLNGAGSAGQAAISLAQSIGSAVFATVETAEDKSVLIKAFDLPEDHIFYSKDDQLSASILKATSNRGIDVVLSIQATADCIQSALRCIAEFGRFVRAEASDVSSKLKLDLSSFSFFSFDIRTLITRKPRIVRRLVKDISRSLKYGKLRPTEDATILPVAEVAEAFKQAKSAPSSNKVIVVPHSEDLVQTTPSKEVAKLFKEDATYILIGGTGGLGRGMTRWMAHKGAKNVVLISRSGSVTGEVKTLVDDMALVGVNVVVHSCNVVKREDVDALLAKLTHLPPIRGVIHTAMVLRDKLFDKMSHNDWIEITESKVHGAWNFHNALLSTPLDFFVVYSSCAAAMGGRGQTAYAAANIFLDAFAQYRRSLGLPGASLGPAAVMDSGYLFENIDLYNEIARNIGDNYIMTSEVLALLETLLDGTADPSCNNHIITGVTLDPMSIQFWGSDAKYRDMRLAAEAVAAQLNAGSKSVSWNAAVKAAASLPEAEQVVCDGLTDKIAKTLGLELEEVDPTRNLSNYALDSLTAIDVRNFITREFESTMQVLELLASGTIHTLAKAILASVTRKGAE